MQVITAPVMRNMIRLLAVGKHRPLYFHGASGIGKSEIIADETQELGGTLCDIRVSQYESIDFRGIPDVQGGTTVWNMPATLPFKGNPRFDNQLADPARPIVLFFDEVNQGDPSVLSVMYQIVLNRRVGEHELMDNVAMVLAGNRSTDRGVTNRFPAPLANRCTHAELIADIKSWTAWASKASVPTPLIGFLNFRPSLLHTFDAAKPETVFATPRTWSYVAEDMNDPTLPADVRQAAMSGSVGEGPAVELGAFIDLMDKIRPIEEIIADPTGIPIEKKLDMQWAMATHVSGHMTKTNVDQLHKFLNRMDPEMVVMAWVMAIQRDESLVETNAFLNEYAPKFLSLFRDQQ